MQTWRRTSLTQRSQNCSWSTLLSVGFLTVVAFHRFSSSFALESRLTASPNARQRQLNIARFAEAAKLIEATTEDDDELSTWKEAFQVEDERSILLREQIALEVGKLGEISKDLQAEFEGCILNLEKAPDSPSSTDVGMWSAAYLAIRRCNEQLELQINEIRAKLSDKRFQQTGDFTSRWVTMDLGPIRYRGIKYTGIEFDRYCTKSGSTIYFVELPMPLGIKLEEREIEGLGRVIEVTDMVEGGSALADGSIRIGDYLRAITTPQRRMKPNDEGEGAGTTLDVMGWGAGENTKAVLVIPRTYPFKKVMEEITKNKEIDSYAGLAFERPFADS